MYVYFVAVINAILLLLYLTFSAGTSANNPDKGKALKQKIKRIKFSSERYNAWWIGHESSGNYRPFELSKHSTQSPNSSAPQVIFTSQFDGSKMTSFCSHLEAIRAIFLHDIVAAIPHNTDLVYIQRLLKLGVVLFEIPPSLCVKRKVGVIVCGSSGTKIISSVFRYYFYEMLALRYFHPQIRMSIADLEHTPIASSLLTSIQREWKEQSSNTLFMAMIPSNSREEETFPMLLLSQCFNSSAFHNMTASMSTKAGVVTGSKEGILLYSRSMTLQIEELIERIGLVEAVNACLEDSGLEQIIVRYLLTSNRVQKYIKIRLLNDFINASSVS